jgi:multidrug resistance efflux pump
MKIRNISIPVILISMICSCNGNKEKGSDMMKMNSFSTDSLINQVTEIVGIGKIEPESQILSLASGRSGIITAVLKSDGDRVKKGEAIVRLDPEVELGNIDLIKARIKTQESQIEVDQYSVKEAEARLANKIRLLESSRLLLENGAETSQNLYDLETEVTVLEADLLRDSANLTISKLKLSELKTELRLSQIELDWRTLTAPADGIILDIKVTPGNSINQFAEFCEFAPDGRIVARCEVDEMFAGRIRTGQEARITLVGRSDVIATGKVIRAAPFLKRKSLFSELPGDREDRRVREVWILLDDNKNLLFNLQVECIILI